MKRLFSIFAVGVALGSAANAESLNGAPHYLVIREKGEETKVLYQTELSCTLVLRHAVGMPEREKWPVGKMVRHQELKGYKAGCFPQG